jgi:voltage-gated potassium channel
MKTSLRFLRIFFKSLGYLAPIWGCLAAIIFGLGWVLARVEGFTRGDGFYLAWVTAFTVGYGDLTPETFLGRLCAMGIALTGMVFTGVWVAVAVNAVKLSVRNPTEPPPPGHTPSSRRP